MPTPPPSPDDLTTWLITKVADAAQIAETEIDLDEPFSSYGIDSTSALGLSGDLEKLTGRTLPPTLLWDFPTIRAVVRHLTEP